MPNGFGERVSTWIVLTVKLDLEGAVQALGTPTEEEPVARGEGRSSVEPAPQEVCRQTQHANSHLDSQAYPVCTAV